MKQDLAGIAGLALVVAGVAFFSRGAAAIVFGLVLMAWAYVTARPEPKD